MTVLSSGLRPAAGALTTPGQGVAAWLDRRAALHPERVALVDGERRLTYGDLNDRALRLAAALERDYGIRPGERVAVLTVNRLEWVELFFATARLGAMLAPLNWRLASPELEFQLRDSGARLLFASPEHVAVAETLAERCVPCGSVSFGDAYERLLAVPGVPATPPAAFDAPHLILYTSGTTGRPKGAVLTQANTFWNCLNVSAAFGLAERDVTLTALPLFHAGGVGLLLLPALYCGARTVVMPGFDAAALLEQVVREQVSVFFGVPATWLELLKQPHFTAANFPSLRSIGSGGAPCPQAVIQQLDDRGFVFLQGYGLTETAPGGTLMPAEARRRKPGSVGKPMLHVSVRVVDETGGDVPPGATGEVLFRGPNVFAGYWAMPEATEAAFTSDDWFRTGDLGRLDDEGFLTLVDRKKDLIISGGENVAAAEVENVLFDHPAVADAAVIGRPDPRWGESVLAIVVRRSPVEPDELIAFCRDRLARFKTPSGVVFVDELPRNAAGKVLKRELRDRLARLP